jgi:hypothetical protein
MDQKNNHYKEQKEVLPSSHPEWHISIEQVEKVKMQHEGEGLLVKRLGF